MNIKKLNTSGYRPQTNGLVEKFNHTLVQAISQYVSSSQRDWDEFLPFACFAYRSAKNETTSEQPYYLLFARQMKMPLDRVYSADEQLVEQNQYMSELSAKFRRAKELFDKQRQQVVKEQEELNAAIKKTHCFDIGIEMWF